MTEETLNAAYAHIVPVEEAATVHLPVPQLAAIVDDYHCNYREFENCIYGWTTIYQNSVDMARSMLNATCPRIRKWLDSVFKFLSTAYGDEPVLRGVLFVVGSNICQRVWCYYRLSCKCGEPILRRNS